MTVCAQVAYEMDYQNGQGGHRGSGSEAHAVAKAYDVPEHTEGHHGHHGHHHKEGGGQVATYEY